MVSKTGHGFNMDDNEECIRIFEETEQMYLDLMGEKMKNNEKSDMLYGDILAAKGDVPLVDNQVFIDWVATYREYPEPLVIIEAPADADIEVVDEIEVVELPQFVAFSFYSDFGAKRIVN